MTTAKLSMPELVANQAQPHVTINAALRIIDGLAQCTVIDRDLTAPPAEPEDGDTYIVAASATGDWSSHDGEIAYYSNTAWVFLAPAEGWRAWITDEDVVATYQNGAWGGVSQAEAVQALGSVSGSQTLDLRQATYFTLEVGGALTLVFDGLPPAGTAKACSLEITGSSASSPEEITWPPSMEWPGGEAIQPTSGGTDVFVVVAIGSRLMSARAMQDVS